MLNTNLYNPDVLTCLANLSSDEVFTPPKLVNEILDLLPDDLWCDKNATFLDPCSKSGVFLREITKRLMEGLVVEIPDLQERINHILTKQVFGIAITELTASLSRRSLYCSKYANGKYSICTDFNTVQGNLRFERTNHTWMYGRCIYCGANQDMYERGGQLETHAYQFIHKAVPEDFLNMKFDVIIGNPPYQLSDGGAGKSAKPIYHHFITKAKNLNPRYLLMIIPSRWFSGGKGLDRFRKEMLEDKRIRILVDYENFKDVFPGVDLAGGACYFLWDRDNAGACKVINYDSQKPDSAIRFLDEFDVFIRQNKALSIINKVRKANIGKKYLDELVSSRKPFGLPTNYLPKSTGVPCWFIQKIGLGFADPADLDDSRGFLNKWKLLIPKAPIAGQTDFSKSVGFYYEGNIRIAKPGECCTESWIVACAYNTEEEVEFFKSYLFTKIFRFLLLQTVVSQDVTKKNFRFVPDLAPYQCVITDEYLRNIWCISEDEWDFINTRISLIE